MTYIGHMRRGTSQPGGPEEREFEHAATDLLDARWDSVPRADMAGLVDGASRVLAIGTDIRQLVAAVGATLADLARAGTEVTMIVIESTDSSDSRLPAIPLLPKVSRWDLRSTEAGALDGVVHDRLVPLLDDRAVVIAPTGASECPVARAATAAARQKAARLLEYDPWPWFSAGDDDSFWSRARWLVPSLTGLRDKNLALEQLGPPCPAVSSLAVEVALVPQNPDLAARVAAVSRSAARSRDIAAPFDMMFDDGNEDPWHLDDSPYEQRRLALVLACLGRPRYRRVIEVGCATGQLTATLAHRADEVIAMDASPKALAVARRRVGAANVRWVLGAAPQDFPDADSDLVVLSEIGYFLDGPDLLSTVRAARRNLAPGGELLMANWRRSTEHIPLDGPAAQRQTAAVLDLPLRARYEDADLVVEVWGQPESVHDEYDGAVLHRQGFDQARSG